MLFMLFVYFFSMLVTVPFIDIISFTQTPLEVSVPYNIFLGEG